MGIVDEDVERVRQSTDIVKLVSEHTQLKRVGRRWSGLCPFHNEKTGSFSVNAEQGVYHCFGCKKSGDSITFVRELEHLDFPGAIEHLARKAGIALRYTDANEGAARNKRKELINHVNHAVEIYHEWLLSHPSAGAARDYLRKRGFDGDMVRAYKVGYAPDTWDALSKKLRISDKDLVDSGLGKINSIGKQMDWQRGRIVFPVFDERGDAVGFGGRIMPGGEGAKYINSQECAVYSKSRVLYGLNWAKEHIVSSSEAIICEGYTDVTGFGRAGIHSAVATCGTALTDDHLKLLKRFTNRIVLAFDADDAGKAAADRVYEWEGKYSIEVMVADLPAGVDPDDLSRSDPERLRESVTNALSFLEFRLERLLARHSMDSIEHRARAAEDAIQLVAEHPNALVRDQYVMTIADRCRMDADRLREMVRNPKRRSATVAEAPLFPAPQQGSDNVEDQAIQLMIGHDHDVSDLLSVGLFVTPMRGEIFAAVRDAPTVREAIDMLGADESNLLRELTASSDEGLDANAVASRLLAKAADRLARQLEAEARSTGEIETLLPDVKFLRQWVIDLREPISDLTELAPLADWVAMKSDQTSEAA
ncbi:MAG: DNA primase [Acidimicrobiia bacterium]|nr:DNA primase [Acidimicrobiia bacterium]